MTCNVERLINHSYFMVAFKFMTFCYLVRDVDFEIIIVDDGSPDGTQDIVKQLQQVYGDNRIVCEILLSLIMHRYCLGCVL